MMDTRFTKNLRNALNHLYDLDYLRKSPLIAEFGIIYRFDVSAVLQRLLIDAIENLHPEINEPPLSEKRKIYEILNFRYIQQFKQIEVAYHLGVSLRQFRREQDNALDVFANFLWKKYSQRTLLENEPAQEDKLEAMENGEWDWLKDAPNERITNPKTFTGKILTMMQPVADHYQTAIQLDSVESLPEIAAHAIAVRQILLNLIQVAIHHAANGTVWVDISMDTSQVRFRIIADTQMAGATHKKEQEENLLKIAAHLTELSDGQLIINQKQGGFTCNLALPAAAGIIVLALDDNKDILALLERYTAETRYQLICSSDPAQLVNLAIHTKAQIIVLDVMMPNTDGWELLGRLRRHPQTAHIPVIILTILDQEELALSLGAKALVLKPVKQDQFLAALDDVSADLHLNSH